MRPEEKKFRKMKGKIFRNVAAPSPQGNNRLKSSTNVEEGRGNYGKKIALYL